MGATRARFAPSPTGELHVGSARTALLNWLFVHATGGTLLLRIDDTDRERSDPETEAAILADLRWLGLSWDDGPVRQSERLARYERALAALPVVRNDGAYEFAGRVIARSDGSPLYHLATAVDDVEDGITHVLRGRDHLSNTELQRAIIEALGAQPPEYVHAPLLTFDGGAKASKRSGGGARVAELRDQGYPAIAICNALALSLADFGTDELMPGLDLIAERFDLSRLHTADSQFDEAKLAWVSGEQIKLMDDATLAAELEQFGASGLPAPAIEAARTGGDTLVACAELAAALIDPPAPDRDALAAIAAPETAVAFDLLDQLVSAWPIELAAAETAFGQLKSQLKQQGVKLGAALHGLRATLTGRTQGPEFPFVLACLTGERVDRARSQLAR